MSDDKPESEGCPFCGETRGALPDGTFLECPECGRDGCDKCMPAGRGCACPECEDGEGEEPASTGDVTTKARAVLAEMRACHHRAVKDALAYLAGGRAALDSEHERRGLDARARSRAVTAALGVWHKYGINENSRHDDTEKSHADRVALRRAVERLAREGGPNT